MKMKIPPIGKVKISPLDRLPPLVLHGPKPPSKHSPFILYRYHPSSNKWSTSEDPQWFFMVAGPEDMHADDTIRAGTYFLRNFYATRFNCKCPADLVVQMRIFYDYISYEDYYEDFFGDTSILMIPAPGFYSSKRKETALLMSVSKQRMLELAFHELNHAFLYAQMRHVPTWYSEGLSEYFEMMQISGNKVEIKPQLGKDQKLKSWLQDGTLDYFRCYASMSHKEWGKLEDRNDYRGRTIAWSAMYFLMSTESGQNTVGKMLHYFKNEYRPTVSLRALNTYYAGGYKQFERDWRKWIPRDRNSHYYDLRGKNP